MRLWVWLVAFSLFSSASGSSSITRISENPKRELVLNALKKKATSNRLKPIQKFLLLLALEANKRAIAHKRPKRGLSNEFSPAEILNVSISPADEYSSNRSIKRNEEFSKTPSLDNINKTKNSSRIYNLTPLYNFFNILRRRRQQQTEVIQNKTVSQLNTEENSNQVENAEDDEDENLLHTARGTNITNKDLYTITIPFAAGMCVLIFILCLILKPTGPLCDEFLKKPGERTRRQRFLEHKQRQKAESRRNKLYFKTIVKENKRVDKVQDRRNKQLEKDRMAALKIEFAQHKQFMKEQKKKESREKAQRRLAEKKRKAEEAIAAKQMMKKRKQMEKERVEDEKHRKEIERAREEKEKQWREKQRQFEAARREYIKQEKERMEREKIERGVEKERIKKTGELGQPSGDALPKLPEREIENI